MSIEAIVWVLDHSASEKAERLVLIVYAEHASKDGTDTYPSVPSVARRSRLGESTVRQARARLLARGELVETGKGPHGQRRFRLPMGDAAPVPRAVRARPGQPAPHAVTPADPAPPAPADPAVPPQSLRPRSSCAHPPQGLAAPPADPAPEPSLEPSKNQNSPKGANAPSRTTAPASSHAREGGSPTPTSGNRWDLLAAEVRQILESGVSSIQRDAESERAERNFPTRAQLARDLAQRDATRPLALKAAATAKAVIQSQDQSWGPRSLFADELDKAMQEARA